MAFQSPPHGRSNSDSSNALTTYVARPRKRTAHAVSTIALINYIFELIQLLEV